MDANSRQIGGEHYKSAYQHWDFVRMLGLDYLPAQITRYLARWRKKNGIEDLEKAIHYLQKFMEDETVRRTHHRSHMEQFILQNRLQEHERIVFNMLVNYKLGDEDRLTEAHEQLTELLALVKGAPSDPEFKDQGDEWRR